MSAYGEEEQTSGCEEMFCDFFWEISGRFLTKKKAIRAKKLTKNAGNKLL